MLHASTVAQSQGILPPGHAINSFSELIGKKQRENVSTIPFIELSVFTVDQFSPVRRHRQHPIEQWVVLKHDKFLI